MPSEKPEQKLSKKPSLLSNPFKVITQRFRSSTEESESDTMSRMTTRSSKKQKRNGIDPDETIPPDVKKPALDSDIVKPPVMDIQNPVADQTIDHVTTFDQAITVFDTNLETVPNQGEYDRNRKRFYDDEYVSGGWDAKARKSASAEETKAQEIIWKIREHERDNLFGNKASESLPGKETLDMGGQFLTNRERIEDKSDLFKIATRMPKGAHLHLHFNAEIPPEKLLLKARDMQNMCIRSTRPLLTQEDFDLTECVFNIMPEDHPSVNIYSLDYNPEFRAKGSNPWMNWKKFQDDFEEKYPALGTIPEQGVGRPPMTHAECWIKAKMVLAESEAYALDQTTNGIWARFNQATRCFKGLLNYEKVFRWYIGAAIDNMIRDGVMYTELRPMLLDKSIPRDDGLGRLTHEDQLKAIKEEYEKKRKDLEDKGQLRKFPFIPKIIYCTPRSIPIKMMRQELRDCIKLKMAYPDMVCGFDLVGAEDRPNSISFYRNELLAFAQTCAELKLDIPFMFHAGETLLDTGGSKQPFQSNLYDAVLLKAKRIGHGFALTKHPLLVEEFKKLDICIELCPTSNELLHLCGNIKEHPYPEILALGIPCTVNSDNPSLFSNSVSFEFYQVMVGTPTMSLHGWKQLAQWSITYSCLSEAEKQEARKIWNEDFEDFCQWIIDTYGEYADKLDVTL